MRPLRLILQAMGPFAGREVIDFRPALDTRLFGIYGPTGAGKTSIFDGICYALFGELSAEMASMELAKRPIRSTFAAPELETYVSLVFEVGEKTYHIQRWPRQQVLKKRGSGTMEKAPSAELFDVSGKLLEEITEPQPGDVVAERKVTVVNQAMNDILGYDANQFRQIVLLPQGEFRKLLTATSDDRSKILRGLFPVGLYERYTDQLREERKVLEAELKTATVQQRSVLESHGVESEAELAVAIENLDQDIAKSTAGMIQIDQNLAAAQAAFGLDQQTETLFIEAEQAEAAQATLFQRQPEIDQAQHALKQAQKAVALQPYEKQASAAAQEFQLLSAQHTEKKATLKKAATAFEGAAHHQKKADARAGERQQLTREISRLENVLEKLTAAGPKVAAQAGAQQEVETLQTSLNTGRALLKETTEAVEIIQAAEKQLATQEQCRLTLENEVLTLRQTYKEAATYEKNMQDTDNAAQMVHLADQHHARQLQTEKLANRAFEEAEAALTATQAFILAQKLQQDDPCPVCGSKDHPILAHEGVAGEGLDQAFRAARDARDQAQLQTRAAADKLAASQGKYDTLKESLKALPVPDISSVDLAEQGRVKAAKLETVKAEIEKIQHQIKKQDVGPLEAQTVALDDTKSKYEAAALRVAELGAALEALLKDVPETDRNIQNAQSTLAQKQQALVKEEQVLQHAQTALKEATKAHIGATAAVTASADMMQQATERRDAAAMTFAVELEKAGLTEADFGEAQARIRAIKDLEKKCTEYMQQASAAKERLTRAQVALEGKTRPDIAATEAAIQVIQDEKTTLSEHQGGLASRQQAYQESQARLAKLKRDFKQQEDQLAIIGTLADLADGRNDEKLRLVDYVIAATFEDVLAAANLRFSKMTQQRYALVRKAEADGGRRKTTLDIMIYDSYTDDLRPASSLSGGEGFLASLSLALGLSDVVQAEAGGIRLDAIFIDEGFGTLSEDVLDSALTTLRDMVGADRAVGVISHLDQVKREIPTGFTIEKTPSGSHVWSRAG